MKTHRITWIVLFALMALPVIVFYSCSDDDDILDENLPTVTTEEVTNIAHTTAKSGGNITDDGGAEVTARGVIWGTSADLTVNDNEGITVNGAGAGSFTSNITGLEPETQYYVRAYATNSNGTGYGNALAFTTLEGVPALSTAEVTSITQTKATGGGNITDSGGATVTERGVIWSTSSDLTLDNNEGITVDGSGAGSFTSNIIGLESATKYYVRAYATNIYGTGYGNAIEFTTLEDYIIYGDGVTDIDGNVYQSVIIGNQEWMAENLRVTKYNNGDAIPTGLSNAEWESTTSGAYAIYPHGGGETEDDVEGINSDEEMVTAYGKLYNWYAVDDERRLCPEGWSIPSDDDWTQLVDYVVSLGFPNTGLGSTHDAANALKSCRQLDSPIEVCNILDHPRWNSDSTHYGFDVFGFSALPGGARSYNGSYWEIGRSGNWWSSSEESYTNAHSRVTYWHMGKVLWATPDKRIGDSVRCFRPSDN